MFLFTKLVFLTCSGDGGHRQLKCAFLISCVSIVYKIAQIGNFEKKFTFIKKKKVLHLVLVVFEVYRN